MARAVTISPFRSYLQQTRDDAALAMVRKRTEELRVLKVLARHESNPAKQRKLATRILATANNLKSWLRYIEEGAPIDTRATVIPGRKETNG